VLDAQSQDVDVDEVESVEATPRDDAAKRSAGLNFKPEDPKPEDPKPEDHEPEDHEPEDSSTDSGSPLAAELSENLARAEDRPHNSELDAELDEIDGPATQRARTRVSDEERQAEKLYDYELVDRFKAGDQGAFEELFSRTREKVYRVAYKVLLNEEDALDVVQDTFITAHKALARL
jgi:hypothetical protein